MDIGPTEIPIQSMLPAEAIRRVEGRSDARQYPQRREPHEKQPEEGEHEAPHDSVDVSPSYRLAHPEHSDADAEDPANADAEGADLKRHLDIEA